MLLKLPLFDKVPREHLFDDELSWEVPEEEHHEEHFSFEARQQQLEAGVNKRAEPAMIPLMNR